MITSMRFRTWELSVICTTDKVLGEGGGHDGDTTTTQTHKQQNNIQMRRHESGSPFVVVSQQKTKLNDKIKIPIQQREREHNKGCY